MKRFFVSALVGAVACAMVGAIWLLAYQYLTGEQRPAREWGFIPGIWMGAMTWTAYSTAFDKTWQAMTSPACKAVGGEQ